MAILVVHPKETILTYAIHIVEVVQAILGEVGAKALRQGGLK